MRFNHQCQGFYYQYITTFFPFVRKGCVVIKEGNSVNFGSTKKLNILNELV